MPFLGLDALGVRTVLPHAPRRAVTINMGLLMPAWYDIRQIDLRNEPDLAGLAESAGQLTALVARERERGVPADKIVLAGFSQGGALALHVGLRYPDALAGIAALSCYLIDPPSLEREASPANRSIPIFQAHGTHDPMVSLRAGEASRDRLQALGYAVEWKTYPVEHQIHPLEVRDLAAWLRGRFE